MTKYFLGIRLPQQLEEECELWRRRFGAPRTVAHITLIPPFTWESTNLLKLLKRGIGSTQPFLIRGRGLDSFGKRVLFVKVELTQDFGAFQHRLAQGLRRAGIPQEKRPYRPHITLATRLAPSQFDRFSLDVADFKPNYAFQCRGISLFKFTQRDGWQEAAKLPL